MVGFTDADDNVGNRRLHVDRGNIGDSWVVLAGSFNGGALVLESGERFSRVGHLYRIPYNRKHWVEAFRGLRYSVVMYRKAADLAARGGARR